MNDLSVTPVPVGVIGWVRNLTVGAFIAFTCTAVAALAVPVVLILRVMNAKWAERWCDFTVGWWIGGLARIWGLELEVNGLDHIDPDQPYVIASPHRSHLDAVASIVTIFPRRSFGVIVKRALTKIPVWGWFIWAGGYIPVDRGSKGNGREVLKRAAQRITDGRTVLIYPEGTRSESHRFLPFKKGAFILARQAGVPILPVVVSGSGCLMPKGRWPVSRGRIRVDVLPPIDTTGKSRQALHEEVYRVLSENYRTSPDAPRAAEVEGLLESLAPQEAPSSERRSAA